MQSAKKALNSITTAIRNHYKTNNWENDFNITREPVNRRVLALQATVIMAIGGAIGGIYAYSPNKSQNTRDWMNEIQDNPDSLSTAEKLIVYERVLQEQAFNHAATMNIALAIIELEKEDESMNTHGKPLQLLSELSSRHFAPANAVLGSLALQELHKREEQDPNYEPNIASLEQIEENLSRGSEVSSSEREAVSKAKISPEFAKIVAPELKLIRFDIISHYVNVGNTVKAKEYLKKLLENTPEATPLIVNTLHEVDIHVYDTFIYQTATASLTNKLQQNKTDPTLLQALSSVHVLFKEFENAINTYEQASLYFTKISNSKEDQANFTIVQEDYEAILETILNSVAPQNLLKTIVESKILSQTQKAALAMRISNTVFPDYLQPIWQTLCTTYVQQSDYLTAEERLENILKKQPNLARETLAILELFGITKFSDDIMNITQAELKAERSKNPTSVELYLYEVELLITQGKWQEAHKMLETIMLYNTIEFKDESQKKTFTAAIRANALQFFSALLQSSTKPDVTATIINESQLITETEKRFFIATLQIMYGKPNYQELTDLYKAIGSSTEDSEFINQALQGRVLNNIAWSMFIEIQSESDSTNKADKLKKALQVALKALDLLPYKPEVLDTVEQIEQSISALNPSTAQ